MSSEEESQPAFLRTKQGEVVPPYPLVEETEGAKQSVEIYLVHRGPDTKRDVVEPVAHLLRTFGVPSFCDSLPELYSMPLGHDKELSMRKGLSFYRFAVVLLSERFCESPYCVKEVNTLLMREHQEKRSIIIPALYTGSLEDAYHAPIFGDRSTLIRRTESSRGFARKLVETVLRRLERPVPSPNVMKYHLHEQQRSLQDIEDSDATLPLSVNVVTTSGSSFSTLSTHTVVGPQLLEWKRPFSVPRHFLQGSVGRQCELSDLHNRLWPTSGCDEVSNRPRGTSAALHGSAGMGKTVLAALYAERYGGDSNEDTCWYPGGVLWLTVGPQRRAYDEAVWIWQEMIQQTFPELLLQEKEAKEGKVYEAAEVRNLLSCRPNRAGKLRSESPLLVVVDDVWSEEILKGTLEALPVDCRVIITTRDAEVAFALENGDCILRLDALLENDAMCLLQSKVKDLGDDAARKLSRGMGCHAQALTLAAGTLCTRRSLGYDKVIDKILNHLRSGCGFGRLPRLGVRPSNNERTVVEKALDFSYDCLQCEDGSAVLQQQFRALGVFAQEAEFSTEAAAHIWEIDEDDALEFLDMLETRALVKMASSTGTMGDGNVRWQQHAVLRAYEQSLWCRADNEDVRQLWKSNHAHYFASLTERCMQKRPRDFDGIDAELRQIQHAFSWCQSECAELAIKFVTSISKYMIVRGLSRELESWLNSALKIAGERDATRDMATILRTRGDIQLQLGQFGRSRAFLEQALPLFDSLNDQDGKSSGKALTFHSIGDVEYRLGRLVSARNFFLNALSLFRLGCDRWGTAVALRSLGDVERFLGNALESRTYLKEAIAHFTVDCNKIGEAGAVLALGRVESRVGNLDEALLHFDRSFALYESAKSQLGQGSTWKCKGDIFLKKGAFDEAKKCYDEALPLFVAMSDKLGEAQTLRCLGDLHMHQGLLGHAEKYLREALLFYDDMNSERDKANTLRSLAAVEVEKGDRRAGYLVYEDAKVLFAKIHKQLSQNDWKHLDQVEYELQGLGGKGISSLDAWTLEEAMQQPWGSSQTLDILSEVER